MLMMTLLIPLLPLLGFMMLVLARKYMSDRVSAFIGVGSVGASAILVALVANSYFDRLAEPLSIQLWTWMSVDGFKAEMGFYIDELGLTMMFVITGVGFLIHLYSVGYMAGDPGFPRFFAYMNLFIAAMLILVMADNLVMLFLGWEGVGLCSYLLIGFWYDKPENGYAARKAFVVTRIGDTAMMLGLFYLYRELGHLDIQAMLQQAISSWPAGSDMAFWAALLLLGGAVGKSAQLPLQTWLPDAMAGPTPISALIHAATMVTAGVYLIARTHQLYILAPDVQQLVAVIGAMTLIMSACTALTQSDIKRVLAYSTMSQIGYMFLALGVGAWSSAIFHLMTHAFFKALLFLAAGAVILAVHHEQNIFKMGGLWRRMPVTFMLFLVGSCALVALPYTSGYFSKHEILTAAHKTHIGLWLAGVAGALLTAIYTSRLIIIAFFGEEQTQPEERRELVIMLPLIILAILALFGMHLQISLDSVFVPEIAESVQIPKMFKLIEALVPFIGIAIAYFWFYRKASDELKNYEKDEKTAEIVPRQSAIQQFFYSGWAMDRLYDAVLVNPFKTLAAINKSDLIDKLYTGIALLSCQLNRLISWSQNGQLRRYGWVMVFGAVIVIGLGVWK